MECHAAITMMAFSLLAHLVEARLNWWQKMWTLRATCVRMCCLSYTVAKDCFPTALHSMRGGLPVMEVYLIHYRQVSSLN